MVVFSIISVLMLQVLKNMRKNFWRIVEAFQRSSPSSSLELKEKVRHSSEILGGVP